MASTAETTTGTLMSNDRFATYCDRLAAWRTARASWGKAASAPVPPTIAALDAASLLMQDAFRLHLPPTYLRQSGWGTVWLGWGEQGTDRLIIEATAVGAYRFVTTLAQPSPGEAAHMVGLYEVSFLGAQDLIEQFHRRDAGVRAIRRGPRKQEEMMTWMLRKLDA